MSVREVILLGKEVGMREVIVDIGRRVRKLLLRRVERCWEL